MIGAIGLLGVGWVTSSGRSSGRASDESRGSGAASSRGGGRYLFSAYRRDLLARTCYDVLKIAFGAAFASKFFLEFAWTAKVAMCVVMLACALAGILLCPRRPAKGGGP